jgi:hypothetical protein
MTATSNGSVSFADFFIPGDKILEDLTRQVFHSTPPTDHEIADLRHQFSRTKYGPGYLQSLWLRVATHQPPSNLLWITAINGIMGGTLTGKIKISFAQAHLVSRQFCETPPDPSKYYEDGMSRWTEKTVQLLLQELIAGHVDNLADEICHYPGNNQDLTKWCRMLATGREKGVGQISFCFCLGLFRRMQKIKDGSELQEQIEELATNCSLSDLKMEPNFGTIVQLPVHSREKFLEILLPRLKTPEQS